MVFSRDWRNQIDLWSCTVGSREFVVESFLSSHLGCDSTSHFGFSRLLKTTFVSFNIELLILSPGSLKGSCWCLGLFKTFWFWLGFIMMVNWLYHFLSSCTTLLYLFSHFLVWLFKNWHSQFVFDQLWQHIGKDRDLHVLWSKRKVNLRTISVSDDCLGYPCEVLLHPHMRSLHGLHKLWGNRRDALEAHAYISKVIMEEIFRNFLRLPSLKRLLTGRGGIDLIWGCLLYSVGLAVCSEFEIDQKGVDRRGCKAGKFSIKCDWKKCALALQAIVELV